MMTRYLLLGLVLFFASCKSHVVIMGFMDDYREGGLLRVRTPENRQLPDVSYSDWYEQFAADRVVPDSTGHFSIRLPLRSIGKVYVGEYNSTWRNFILSPGDTLFVVGGMDSIRFSTPKSSMLNLFRKRMVKRGREGVLDRGFFRSLLSTSLGEVDSLRIVRTYDSALRAEERYYDSLLRSGGIGIRTRRLLVREYVLGKFGFVSTPDSVRSRIGRSYADAVLAYYASRQNGDMRPRRIDLRSGRGLSSYRSFFSNGSRYQESTEAQRLIWHFAKGIPTLRSRALRNQSTAVSNFDAWLPRELDTTEWIELLRMRHLAFGGTPLDSLVQDAGAAYLLQRRWGDSPRRRVWGELHHLDSLWMDGSDKRPILLWAWVVGDPTGLRGLAKRVAVERELSKRGVRVVYVCFNNRDFNLRMDMWGMGLRGEYASAMGQARRDLLRLFGVREYRRSRFALLTHDGKLLDGELPLPQEGEKFLGRIRELLARHDGEMVEE